MIRFAAPATLLLAAGLSACAPQQGDDAVAKRISNQEPAATGLATSILNAGVMTELGDQQAPVKFLFDPLYDNHFGSLAQLTEELIEAIVSGAPPYHDVTAVFISHAHGDHFSARHITRMLAAQPELRLVAPGQAVERMRKLEIWDDDFARRINTITLENGQAAAQFKIAGATVEAFRSPHSGWPDRHANIHNISYRVSAPRGGALVPVAHHRVMHMGDADPALEHLAPHSELFGEVRTGLVMVPYWFVRAEEPRRLIDATLNAEAAVAIHVPVEEPDFLATSGWGYFTEEGQHVTVPATP